MNYLKFKYKKTGKIYDVNRQLCIKCTNNIQDDKQISISYTDGENEFFREASEFFQKVEYVNPFKQEPTTIIGNIKPPQEDNIQYCECGGDFAYIVSTNPINPLFPTKKCKCKSCGKLKN